MGTRLWDLEEFVVTWGQGQDGKGRCGSDLGFFKFTLITPVSHLLKWKPHKV